MQPHQALPSPNDCSKLTELRATLCVCDQNEPRSFQHPMNVTGTELELLLRKAEEYSLIAKLAIDPKIRETNETLAKSYFEMAAQLSDPRFPPQAA